MGSTRFPAPQHSLGIVRVREEQTHCDEGANDPDQGRDPAGQLNSLPPYWAQTVTRTKVVVRARIPSPTVMVLIMEETTGTLTSSALGLSMGSRTHERKDPQQARSRWAMEKRE
jgi:hypothetical protein